MQNNLDISFRRLLLILTLNDESLYSIFPSKDAKEASICKDRVQEKNSRVGYLIGLIVVGVLSFFVKIFAEQMFSFLPASLLCDQNSLTQTCFSLMMVYRFSMTLVIYHLVMLLINLFGTSETNFINDFCWMFKAIVLVEIFFLTCLIPNSIFEVYSAVAKYASIVILIMIVIFSNDILYFYFSRRRLREMRIELSGTRQKGSFILGLASFLAGIGLFGFSIYWHNRMCTEYLIIQIALAVLGLLIVVVNFMKYRGKLEINHALVLFLLVSVMNFGLVAATPYSTCYVVDLYNAQYSKAASYLDSALR